MWGDFVAGQKYLRWVALCWGSFKILAMALSEIYVKFKIYCQDCRDKEYKKNNIRT